MKRAVFGVILFISVFTFPWWISALLLLAGMFIFKNFYEFFVANVIIYSLHAVPGERLFTSPIFYSLLIVVIYIVLQIIRDNIIFYKK